MSYTKPMVTIELEEYNSLVQAKKDFEKSEVSVYQKALSTVFTRAAQSGVNPESITKDLKNQGIAISFVRDSSSDILGAPPIKVSVI